MIVEQNSARSAPSEFSPRPSACADAARLRVTLTDPAMLRGAMRRHVERCRACREDLLAQEPTTLFRRLPKVELSADEIAEMRQRVKGVRRARQVGGASTAAQASRPTRSNRSTWAAAAVTLAVFGGAAAVQTGWMSRGANPMAAPTVNAPAVSALSAEDEAHLDRALASRALIDGTDVLSEQVVLMQVAGRASDLAWVANDRLDL